MPSSTRRITPMIVLIDNGHGRETRGKCSPDQRLREWKYTREIAKEVVVRLSQHGVNAQLLTPEDGDISIAERCRRANNIYRHFGKDVLLVSIHCNAKGSDDVWHDARGWQVCVSMNASARSKQLASYLFDAAQTQGLKMRSPRPNQKWWQQNLAICRDTMCPTILTENLFMDNEKDVDFLLSEAGRQAIISAHVDGIINFINSYGR